MEMVFLNMRLIARENREMQIRKAASAANIWYGKVDPPAGITLPRWKAMIAHIRKNGVPS